MRPTKELVAEVIAEYPDLFQELKGGKTELYGFLAAQAMRKSMGEMYLSEFMYEIQIILKEQEDAIQ